MPHGGGADYPWIDEDRKCAWRLLILNTGRGRGCIGSRSTRCECEQEGCISVQVLDVK